MISRHRVTMTFTLNFLLGLLNASAAPTAGLPTADAPAPPAAATGAGHTRGGACAGAYDPAVERLDLRSLRHIVSGGEANVLATGEAFLARYAQYGLRGDALWLAFGMTETCAGSVYSRDFPQADAGREFASLGQPVRGLRLRVADARGRVCPAGEVGELQLRGPMITDGYHRDPAATARAHTPDGWFRSGDLGRIDGLGDGAPSVLVGGEAGPGRLVLVGRAKDSVIVNGVNYFSADIESAVERLDGVAPGHVAAFPTRQPGYDTEQLVVALRPEPAAASGAALHRLLNAVRATVVAHWGFRPAHVLPLPASAFPKTSLGKTLRQRMRERLEAGAYDAVIAEVAAEAERRLGGHVTPEGATERVLADIYAELFERVPARVSATASFFDLGGTSLDILRLRRLVATRLAVAELPVITVLTAPTVRQLAARLDAGPSVVAGAEAYDPVVPLQTGGDKTPLLCVHPGVGEVLVFVNLARYFTGDRPFFALRARGFNQGERPFGSFAEMVETYVRAIRARQPHGLYAIAGYSYGGAVAFEIAKRLEALGERVGFVGSLNLPPHIKYRMDELDFVETATNLALFLDLVDRPRARTPRRAARPAHRGPPRPPPEPRPAAPAARPRSRPAEVHRVGAVGQRSDRARPRVPAERNGAVHDRLLRRTAARHQGGLVGARAAPLGRAHPLAESLHRGARRALHDARPAPRRHLPGDPAPRTRPRPRRGEPVRRRRAPRAPTAPRGRERSRTATRTNPRRTGGRQEDPCHRRYRTGGAAGGRGAGRAQRGVVPGPLRHPGRGPRPRRPLHHHPVLGHERYLAHGP